MGCAPGTAVNGGVIWTPRDNRGPVARSIADRTSLSRKYVQTGRCLGSESQLHCLYTRSKLESRHSDLERFAFDVSRGKAVLERPYCTSQDACLSVVFCLRSIAIKAGIQAELQCTEISRFDLLLKCGHVRQTAGERAQCYGGTLPGVQGT